MLTVVADAPRHFHGAPRLPGLLRRPLLQHLRAHITLLGVADVREHRDARPFVLDSGAAGDSARVRDGGVARAPPRRVVVRLGVCRVLRAGCRIEVRRLHESVAQRPVRVPVRAGAILAAGRAALVEPEARLAVGLVAVQACVAPAGLAGARAPRVAALGRAAGPGAALELLELAIRGVARHPANTAGAKSGWGRPRGRERRRSGPRQRRR